MNKTVFASLAAMLLAVGANAQPLQISITNEGNSDFFLTPLWYGLHDGTFDLFNPGEAATPGLELIAEDGDPATLLAEFAAAPGTPGDFQGVIGNPAGFGGAPVIDPGETATTLVTPGNPAAYRWFSYASMVIPSNDAFIGNGNPTAYELFDAGGSFQGPLTITILGSDIWDAGTEENNGTGAAFSALANTPVDENGVVTAQPDLGNFLGTGIPTGGTIQNLIDSQQVLATITVTQIPEPTTGVFAMMAVAAMGFIRRKR